MYIWIRENSRFLSKWVKKHFPVRVGDALEAETIFDSTHAKIHIALKEGREKPKAGVRKKERERERERDSRRMANRRVCKCSTRGCDAVMGEKNCLFQRPTFSQAHYLPDNLDCGLHVDEIFSVYACTMTAISALFAREMLLNLTKARMGRDCLARYFLRPLFPWPFYTRWLSAADL